MHKTGISKAPKTSKSKVFITEILKFLLLNFKFQSAHFSGRNVKIHLSLLHGRKNTCVPLKTATCFISVSFKLTSYLGNVKYQLKKKKV